MIPKGTTGSLPKSTGDSLPLTLARLNVALPKLVNCSQTHTFKKAENDD